MKSDRSIKDLYKIIEIEGISRKNGVIARKDALDQWIKDWVEEIEISQSVIKKSLTIRDEEFIKYYMAKKISEVLMDNCVALNIDKNTIKIKVLALKR